MKLYEVVNTITTDTYSLEQGTGTWTEQMLLDAGMTLAEIREYTRSGDLFEITFLNPPLVVTRTTTTTTNTTTTVYSSTPKKGK